DLEFAFSIIVATLPVLTPLLKQLSVLSAWLPSLRSRITRSKLSVPSGDKPTKTSDPNRDIERNALRTGQYPPGSWQAPSTWNEAKGQGRWDFHKDDGTTTTDRSESDVTLQDLSHIGGGDEDGRTSGPKELGSLGHGPGNARQYFDDRPANRFHDQTGVFVVIDLFLTAKPSIKRITRTDCLSNTRRRLGSAGGLVSGKGPIGNRLSKSTLLEEFSRHSDKRNRIPTALVSASDRIVDAVKRAFDKYYSEGDSPAGIWIAFIEIPSTIDEAAIPMHPAKKLAEDCCLFEPNRFCHEVVFEWAIPEKYIVHQVSL
ncbi:MAG: hypothetical protein Q9169_007722, partial [Polycauliona sp. 2 TL-2023]